MDWFLDRFSNDTKKNPHPYEFDYLLEIIFHEFVHGKGLLGLDKENIPSTGNKEMDEYIAYNYTANHAHFNLSSDHADFEFGKAPIHNLETLGEGVFTDHLAEVRILLTKVSPGVAAELKKEIHDKFGISL
jgi:hypothetical protein